MNICGKEYFTVEVLVHTAFCKAEQKTVKSEAIRAREEAARKGYNISTKGRFTIDNRKYYTFTK